MFTLQVRNVDEAYALGGVLLRGVGITEDSRNGPVLVAPRPVTTHYARPRERVLFDVKRDANPFFHLMESLWILAGRDDVEFPSQFAGRLRNYSDDGETFHGAYGRRLRYWGAVRIPGSAPRGLDQLTRAIDMLIMDPGSRRVVLSLWDPSLDLGTDSRDLPCNDMIKLEVRDGRLNLIVFNRSNDIIWGCYGANVVQFSMIQEYVAGMLGVRMGFMEQVSTNWHAYRDVWEEKAPWMAETQGPYHSGQVRPYDSLVSDASAFDEDLANFLDIGTTEQGGVTYNNPFFPDVAEPLYWAWYAWKHRDFITARGILAGCRATDWKLAALQWLARREGR